MRRYDARTGFAYWVFAKRARYICFLLGVLLLTQEPCRAQAPITPDVNVISQGERFTNAARLAVDPSGTVHVFYGAYLGPDPGDIRAEPHNTVMYTSGSLDRWAEPIDVLVPHYKDDPGVRVNVALYSPKTDRLYVLWRSNTELYLSSAPIDNARSARAWETQVMFQGSSYWGTLALDSSDVMHVVYDSNYRDIFYMQSSDTGATWSSATLLFTVPSDQVAYSGTRLIVDAQDHLHLVWEEAAAERDWNPVAVWYAQSIDGGRTWTPFEVQRRTPNGSTVGGINVGLGHGADVFLIWNHGAGSVDGRYFRWSTDGGVSWTEPQVIWSNSQDIRGGQAGWGFPLLDGGGVLHLITAVEDREAFTQGLGGGLRYATWTGNGWSPSIHLTTCEFPDAVVSQGNLLHIVCPTFDGSGRIKYIQVTTQASSIPVSAKKPVLAALTSTPTAPITATIAATVEPTDNAAPSLTRTQLPVTSQPPQDTAAASAIVLSSIASLLVVFPVVVMHVRKRR